MNIDLKGVVKKLTGIANKHPVFLRIITQCTMFITTFGLHNSSPFWHVVCLVSMCVMSVFTISDGKLRKASLEKSEQVVEILQEAISDMIESGSLEVSENFEEITSENKENPTQEEVEEAEEEAMETQDTQEITQDETQEAEETQEATKDEK